MSSMIFFIVFVCILAVLFLVINFLFAPHNPAIWRLGKSIMWEKLSNSGNPLKLLVPNHNLNIVGGCINNSCMVISQEMIERKMGNHGSKSIIFNKKNVIVKEERVKGSWHKVYTCELRCILMGFERNYQVGILFNQINKQRMYTSIVTQSDIKLTMDPWFVTGFTDGEGCFIVSIIKDNKYKLGWRVICRFEISLNNKDLDLLKKIKSYFGVGNIYFTGKDNTSIQYRIESASDLVVIINHFDKYPLITKKLGDYLLFKQAFELIQGKQHLTEEGLKKLVSIKAVLNNGLSDNLKIAFSKTDVIPALRPEVKLAKNISPNWLVGFVDAEGCFNVQIFKSTTKTGEAVKLSFIVTQHIRDECLIRSLIDYFGCGNININRKEIYFKITKFSYLIEKVIPFFEKYSLQGVKSKDFNDFCKVSELMQNKIHLTTEGLSQIHKIKAGMNSGRQIS